MLVFPDENPFDPIQTATTHAHPLSQFQEWVRRHREVIRQCAANGIDLGIRDGGRFSVYPDPPEQTWRAQHLPVDTLPRHDVYEDVTKEQRHFDELPTITPEVRLTNCGYEGGDTLFHQLHSDFSF